MHGAFWVPLMHGAFRGQVRTWRSASQHIFLCLHLQCHRIWCVGSLCRILALKEREKALAGSVVKIAARDVVLSKKIMISIVVVPALWMIYAVLLMLFTTWNTPTKVRPDPTPRTCLHDFMVMRREMLCCALP